MNIDKQNPMPLYFQLKNILLEKIENGEYKPNTALPAEFELVEQYDVSRTTVRQAISMLVNEGYLEKRRGVGTFIRKKEKTNTWDLQQLRSFRAELESSGHKISTQCRTIKKMDADEELKGVFGEDVTKLYCLERLRYVDDIPAICVTTYVPCEVTPSLEKYDFSVDPLFEIMNRDYQIHIQSAEKVFQAIKVSDQDAQLLQVEPGSPVQLVITKTFNDQGQVIEYSKSRDRGDISTYKVQLQYSE